MPLVLKTLKTLFLAKTRYRYYRVHTSVPPCPPDTPLRYACGSSGVRAAPPPRPSCQYPPPPPPPPSRRPPPPHPNCPPPLKFWQIAGGGGVASGPVVVAPPPGGTTRHHRYKAHPRHAPQRARTQTTETPGPTASQSQAAPGMSTRGHAWPSVPPHNRAAAHPPTWAPVRVDHGAPGVMNGLHSQAPSDARRTLRCLAVVSFCVAWGCCVACGASVCAGLCVLCLCPLVGARGGVSVLHALMGMIAVQVFSRWGGGGTAPTHQLLGSVNAEITPARAPAAAADRTQRPDATCEGKNG